jgi:hypothetical protein
MKNDAAKLLKQIVTIAALALVVSVGACRSKKENLNRPVDNGNAAAPVQPVSQSAFDVVDSKVIEKQSPFDHSRKEHQTKTKDCAFCHVRKDNSPTPIFPSHPGCIECHQKDFTNRQSRMCEVCHTTPVDAKGTLIEFPKKQSEFGLKGFSHRQHTDAEKMKGQMDAASGAPACDKCHAFDQAKVVAAFPHHPECFSCHAHQAGAAGQAAPTTPTAPAGQANKNLGDCGTCHVKRDQAIAFSRGTGPAFALYNFRHGPHLAKSGDCTKCHKTTEAAPPVRADITEINVARGQRHHSDCWDCHVTAKESACTKCHKSATPF